MGRIFPLLSQYMCNFDREQTGRHLHRLFAISRQHLCVCGESSYTPLSVGIWHASGFFPQVAI